MINRRKLLGPLRANWKGGKSIDSNGYVCIRKPDHPKAMPNGYVKEHIMIMEQFLGRRLMSNEEIHHKNGIRDDNRIENLELHTTATHSEIEMKKRWDSGRMRKVNFNHIRDPKTGRFI